MIEAGPLAQPSNWAGLGQMGIMSKWSKNTIGLTITMTCMQMAILSIGRAISHTQCRRRFCEGIALVSPPMLSVRETTIHRNSSEKAIWEHGSSKSMDAEEVRRVVKEELEAYRRKDTTAKILTPFALWVGTISLASFILTVMLAKETISGSAVDAAAAVSLLVAVALVFLSIILYGHKS